jgi:hypothetical protein
MCGEVFFLQYIDNRIKIKGKFTMVSKPVDFKKFALAPAHPPKKVVKKPEFSTGFVVIPNCYCNVLMCWDFDKNM